MRQLGVNKNRLSSANLLLRAQGAANVVRPHTAKQSLIDKQQLRRNFYFEPTA